MTCCSGCGCSGTDRFFSRWSKTYAKRFRKKGPDKVQKYLLEGIRLTPVSSARILDIGCGVGALHLTLLKEGAAHATGIDAAEGMVQHAKTMARELSLDERTSYVVGDFSEKAPDLPDADIVTLDKVVCCYDNLDALLAGSLQKARRVFALSRPNDRIHIHWVFVIQIFLAKLFRAAFHPYWHDWTRMDGKIVAGGFREIYRNSTFMWSIAVYQRI